VLAAFKEEGTAKPAIRPKPNVLRLIIMTILPLLFDYHTLKLRK
jgi:hypothetical protein